MPDSPKRFLWPREHGAWAQMAMPLVTGLALGRPGAAAWLFAAAAALAFLAHEPGLVLLGTRGVRARQDDGALARRLLALLGGPALALGAVAFALAPPYARLAIAPAAALVLATVGLARRRLEMTTGGEVVAGATMASSLLPVALSSGVAPRAAIAAFLAWVLSFAVAAVAVEAVLARGRPGAPDLGRRNALRAGLLWALGAGAAVLLGLSWALPVALAPTALFAAAVCLRGTGPGRLKALGWALVAGTAATLLLLVLGLRGG
ncbi:MAG TPA: YwiC-like family protein [Anaeromyxobacteraceae bacterium]|nr:YwiC-like family protein [Anaeromyxobacteraceae bacterium]